MNAKPFCGNPHKRPPGRPQGTPSYCFVSGRKSGFVGGIQSQYIKKSEIENNGEELGQRALQAIAKALGIPRYGRKKSEILPAILAHNWVKVSAKECLFAL